MTISPIKEVESKRNSSRKKQKERVSNLHQIKQFLHVIPARVKVLGLGDDNELRVKKPLELSIQRLKMQRRQKADSKRDFSIMVQAHTQSTFAQQQSPSLTSYI